MLRLDDQHEPAPVATRADERSPTEWTDAVRSFALETSDEPVELCGVTKVDGGPGAGPVLMIPAAISHTEEMVRGVDRWYVDFDRCMPYFAASYGCGICIAACPWSTPGEAPRLAEIMSRRREGPSAGNQQ